MTAELRRDLGGVERHATVPLPAQRSPYIPAAQPSPERSRWQGRYTGAVVTVDLAAVVASAALYGLWGNAAGGSVAPRRHRRGGAHRASRCASRGPGSRRCSGRARSSSRVCCAASSARRSSSASIGLALELTAGPAVGVRRAAPRRRAGRRRPDAAAQAAAPAPRRRAGRCRACSRWAPRRPSRRSSSAPAGPRTTAGGSPGSARPPAPARTAPRRSTACRSSATSTPSPRWPWTGRYDAVSVGQAPGWTPRRLQQLAWDLEGSRTQLVVDPGLMEIAGPRLHIDNVDGLPLLRLTHPTFAGAPQLLKGAIDRLAALLILLLIWPVLLGLAIAVRADGGPAFFRQTRVGRGGREFQVLKFRSMVVDAEQRLADLQARNEGAGVLFKMKDDPRVTPIGRVPAPVLPRRAPPAVQRARRLDVAGRPAPPLPREVARLRARRAAPPAGQARHHRAVAGQRAQRPVVGADGPARPALRRELDPRPRRADPRGRPSAPCCSGGGAY